MKSQISSDYSGYLYYKTNTLGYLLYFSLIIIALLHPLMTQTFSSYTAERGMNLEDTYK
jgi:hypothetical protein